MLKDDHEQVRRLLEQLEIWWSPGSSGPIRSGKPYRPSEELTGGDGRPPLTRREIHAVPAREEWHG